MEWLKILQDANANQEEFLAQFDKLKDIVQRLEEEFFKQRALIETHKTHLKKHYFSDKDKEGFRKEIEQKEAQLKVYESILGYVPQAPRS